MNLIDPRKEGRGAFTIIEAQGSALDLGVIIFLVTLNKNGP